MTIALLPILEDSFGPLMGRTSVHGNFLGSCDFSQKPNQRILRTPSASEGELVSMDCFRKLRFFPKLHQRFLRTPSASAGKHFHHNYMYSSARCMWAWGKAVGMGFVPPRPREASPENFWENFPESYPKNLPRNRFCFDFIRNQYRSP